MKIQQFCFNSNYCSFVFIFLCLLQLEFQPVLFQSYCSASMGTVSVNCVNANQISSSDQITLSKTTLTTLASQQRNITINDVSGTMMVTGFSNILTSTTLNSNHNGVILISGETTLTLPDPSTVLGISYTLKKIDLSSNIVTIAGIVDGESNPQLTTQYSYITIISNGYAWYKVGENISESVTSVDQTYISNSLGMTFRLIPAGSFEMGSPVDEPGRITDETQYTVTISDSFYIQTTEVTQGQWEKVMGSNPSNFSTCGHNCPVEYISWDEAQSFISNLNSMGEGTYALPTEAQWEYASRAGSNKAFANGDISNTTTTDPNLEIIGWYNSNSNSSTRSVAQKQPNAWGLFDMHGNVWELCQDWYGEYPATSATDPTGPSSGSYYIKRGGAWNNQPHDCRSAEREGHSPGFRSNYTGLRLKRNL